MTRLCFWSCLLAMLAGLPGLAGALLALCVLSAAGWVLFGPRGPWL